MSKPFDLEAAKRGEPVEIYQPSGDYWHPVIFVGIRKSGRVLLDSRDGYLAFDVPGYKVNDSLRMAPKKAARQYRRFKRNLHDGTILIDVLNSRGIIYSDPHDLERSSIFAGWIDFEWQTVEIEL